MGDQIFDQGPAKPRGRKKIAWRRDAAIIARLDEVERLHLAGLTNVAIAAKLRGTEGTVRNDLKRLSELWQERLHGDQERLRDARVRELEEIKRRAIAAAEFDEAAERAVLFGEIDAGLFGDGARVQHDKDGRAQFRGNKAQALNVARQAVMDAAKVQGLVIEKQEHSGNLLQRVVILDDGDGDGGRADHEGLAPAGGERPTLPDPPVGDRP